MLNTLPFKDYSRLETRAVLKKTAQAHRRLAELKGLAASIPNESILLNTLTLQEAKDSSAVENIIITHNELYKANLFFHTSEKPAAKEVRNYAAALRQGFDAVRSNGIIHLANILSIQQTIEKNNAGLRKLPGTTLKNAATDEIIYTPPQDAKAVERLMHNLVDYMNIHDTDDLDPLVKMAIIHHQFESIHPFYDGNGRTGRIINILYLVAQNLLDLPILYLSRYFIQDKAEYYRQLQAVRNNGKWEPWILYMLEGIHQTSQQTIALILAIKQLLADYKQGIRQQLPKIYRQELLNNLFHHPYTKIDFVMEDLNISRITATKYLEQLVSKGFLQKEKLGRSNYYINQPLLKLLIEG
ncbi:MAG: Fic family protein [Gammaproteobacteria bacterium]|nr:Fic family protein [Gammaproteobacteria bacterium]